MPKTSFRKNSDSPIGLLRCISVVDSGCHFLQTNEQIYGQLLPHSTYFKSLKSHRRTSMLEAFEQQSYHLHAETLLSQGIDYLKAFPELDEYTIEAADGHFIDHACHTEKKQQQARHATSRNSGTPVAIIRSPTQRMGDALNALRPQRLRTKAASSLLPHWLDGYSECNSCSSRVLLAHVESANCPVAYQGLKITTSLSSVSMIFSVSSLFLHAKFLASY
ncbi:hypothetical protein [Bathymodiolus japonicus methanotrophic gill symbiont]|uniref:hypothetical protein n=3 Tax=Gammaproteobacteria TaxID=1236 RepID=UPI001C8EA057|nr:hypothetical protein [Bathymodiolus japonicus methanotrophic gill symbiont]